MTAWPSERLAKLVPLLASTHTEQRVGALRRISATLAELGYHDAVDLMRACYAAGRGDGRSDARAVPSAAPPAREDESPLAPTRSSGLELDFPELPPTSPSDPPAVPSPDGPPPDDFPQAWEDLSGEPYHPKIVAAEVAVLAATRASPPTTKKGVPKA